MARNLMDKAAAAQLLPPVGLIAQHAGAIIMHYYANTDETALKLEIKDDNSPVTAADKAASDYIVQALTELTPTIPVVSEENDIDPNTANGAPYWVVDPLDGTKEFLARTGGFCVKIALIAEGRPVIGVVYSPVQDVLYMGATGLPAMRQIGSGAIHTIQTRPAAPAEEAGRLRVLFNQTHADPALYDATRERLADILHLPETPAIRPGLPRNLQVAQGTADLHVGTGRDETLEKGGGYQWDIAADLVILQAAGGNMQRLKDGGEVLFTAPRDRLPSYIAYGDAALRYRLTFD